MLRPGSLGRLLGRDWESHSGEPILASILMQEGPHSLLPPISAIRQNSVQPRPDQCGQFHMNWNHGDLKLLKQYKASLVENQKHIT